MHMDDLDFRVKKKNLYETVADRMEDMILDNSLRQGERLPSEQDLALKFGISRNVMRESLKLLKERQLIVQKNGEGTFIAKPEGGSVTEVLNRMLRLDDIGYMDVYEMRRILEPYACRVVAMKQERLDFDELERCLQGMIDSKDVWDKRIDYDIQFHVCIAEATGNPLLICFIKSMVNLWKTILLRGIVTQQEGHQDGIEFHQRIMECLRKGDPEESDAVMKAHIEKSAKMCWVDE